MDVSLVIRRRLEELHLEQRDLATAANVTESYISQLLTGKKSPPASDRTGIYARMEKFLKLPKGNISDLADHARHEELKRSLGESAPPLLKELRELILRKCAPGKRKQVQSIFEKQPLGELEHLAIQKLLDVAKRAAKEEMGSERRLRRMARLVGRSYDQMRMGILEFLDADVFSVTVENCHSFLEPLIQSWDIDLRTFAMEIVLNRRLSSGSPRKFEFVEKEADGSSEEEPGFKRFLRERLLSGDASEQEIEFLKRLRFNGKRPTALYYYRELQNLRDPLHFTAVRIIHQSQSRRSVASSQGKES